MNFVIDLFAKIVGNIFGPAFGEWLAHKRAKDHGRDEAELEARREAEEREARGDEVMSQPLPSDEELIKKLRGSK